MKRIAMRNLPGSLITSKDDHNGGTMNRKVKTRLSIGLSILVAAGLIAGSVWIFRPKPVAIEMDTPVAVEAMSIVRRMYLLEGSIHCVPGTTVEVFAEIMADTSDYHATPNEKSAIEKVFGRKALTHAGFLTSRQADDLVLDLPVPPPPTPVEGPTLRPTPKGVYLCRPESENTVQEYLRFVSVGQWQDGHVVVTYDYLSGASGRFEAILRMIDGKWKITSVKMIEFYGNG
jgi:hypothetical protein